MSGWLVVVMIRMCSCGRSLYSPFPNLLKNAKLSRMNELQEFPKAYIAADHEKSIYEMWENSGAFSPHTDTSKPAFSIIMPPPNANGNLHTGHALMIPLEDIMVRYHRSEGGSYPMGSRS